MMSLLVLLLGCTSNPSSADTSGDTDETAGIDDPADTTAGTADTDDTDDTDDTADTDGAGSAEVEPPLDGTSGGSGGADLPQTAEVTLGGVSCWLLAPSGSAAGQALPLLVVFSGTEGSATMMSNLRQVAPYYGLEDALIVVLNGQTTAAADGAAVLDAVRDAYDVDNDRTWLLSESAGTAAGLTLGLSLRQSWFAAYWANDVNTSATPTLDADALGFAPWGSAGPGGDWPDANAIVAGMEASGYRLPSDAPYSGSGADTHGSTNQFLAAVAFFAGKER